MKTRATRVEYPYQDARDFHGPPARAEMGQDGTWTLHTRLGQHWTLPEDADFRQVLTVVERAGEAVVAAEEAARRANDVAHQEHEKAQLAVYDAVRDLETGTDQ